MQDEIQKSDEEIWKDIYEQFNKIKEEIGIEPDEEYRKELEDMFGMSIDDQVKLKLLYSMQILQNLQYPKE